jgi:hypothetical protein
MSTLQSWILVDGIQREEMIEVLCRLRRLSHGKTSLDTTARGS